MPVDVQISIDTAPLIRALRELGRELPRATRNTLNDVARAVQATIRERAAGEFNVLRPPFLNRAVYIGPQDRATTEKLVARVSLAGPAPDIYAQHDESGLGRKVVTKGKNLVIPSRAIRTTGGHVARGNRFKEFGPFVTQGGAVSTLRKKGDRLVSRGSKTLRGQVVGKRGSFFVTLRSSGLTALMQRQRGEGSPRVLYVLKPAVTLPKRFQFHSWAEQAIAASYDAIVARELDRAMQRVAEGR